MDWICYFEKYNTDRKLLDSVEAEIDKIVRSGYKSDKLDKLKSCRDALTSSLLRTDDFLQSYVESAGNPREAAQRSQEMLYLRLRYGQEMTMEQTAEAMCVSRDTVYRIRRRIISRGDIFNCRGA